MNNVLNVTLIRLNAIMEFVNVSTLLDIRIYEFNFQNNNVSLSPKV